jgi:methionine sulfoxide reductase heme-binding subunit
VATGLAAWILEKWRAWADSAVNLDRPFITVGFTTRGMMTPLAVTSTAGMIRRLGGRRWNRLHTVVYATAVLGVVPYWWLVKGR